MKLILFTGKSSLNEAVAAFNEGIIDAYLPKDDPDLSKKINDLFFHHSWNQFLELSKNLGGVTSHVMKPLCDTQCAKTFHEVIEKYHIVEFFVLDTSCSTLMLDDSGNAIIWLLRNENDFNECYYFAKDSHASYEILEALRGRQQYPFVKGYSTDYLKLEKDAWENVMQYMTKIPGRELYYSIIKRPTIKAISFNKYCGEIWPQP